MKSRKGLVLAFAALLIAVPTAQAVPPPEEETGMGSCLADVAACMTDRSLGEEEKEDGAPQKADGPGLLDHTGQFFASIGAAIAAGAANTVDAVGDAAAGIGSAVLASLAGLATLLLILRPEDMPVIAFAGVAAGGTAAVAGGAQAGIWTAWRRWGWLLTGAMGLFSRIEKDELLENAHRAHIHELIKQQPGIHLSEISRVLDLAWGTTLHHLRKLREQRLVSIKKVGHHKCYFLNGSGYTDTQMQALSLLKNQTLADVASAIEAHPDTSLKQLSTSLGISSPLAAHHVKTLEKAGLIRKERAGKEVRIAPTELVPRGFFNGLHPHACAAEGAVGFA